MRRRDYYWSLFHQPEKNQLDNLKTDHVEVIFAAIPESMHSEYWVWREGFDDWKPLTDFPYLLSSLRQLSDREIETPKPPGRGKTTISNKATPSPAPRNSRNKIVVEDNEPVATVNLTLMAQSVGEDRSNMRFKREFDLYVLLADGKKSLLGKTLDISLKGMSLKTPLPKNLPPFFSVEIRRNKDVIPLVCSEIKSSDGKPSNKLRIEANEYLPALLTLLLQTPETAEEKKR